MIISAVMIEKANSMRLLKLSVAGKHQRQVSVLMMAPSVRLTSGSRVKAAKNKCWFVGQLGIDEMLEPTSGQVGDHLTLFTFSQIEQTSFFEQQTLMRRQLGIRIFFLGRHINVILFIFVVVIVLFILLHCQSVRISFNSCSISSSSIDNDRLLLLTVVAAAVVTTTTTCPRYTLSKTTSTLTSFTAFASRGCCCSSCRSRQNVQSSTRSHRHIGQFYK